MFLTRLSPLFPFNLLNYLFGITCVSLKDYVIGSLGMIPGTFLYVYFGSLVGDVAALHVPLDMPEEVSLSMRVAYGIVRLLGLFATIAVTVQITRIARRSLRQSLAQSLAQSPVASPFSSPFPAPKDSSHDSIH